MRALSLWLSVVAGMTLGGGVFEVEKATAERDLPTIVSLNPCTDAILAEVAEPAQVLAISHYSHDPSATSMDLAQARRFHAIGGTVEEVLALDPDVVLASNFLTPATRNALDDLGIRVETFDIAPTVEDSLAHVERIGAVSRQPDKAARLASRIASSVAALEKGRGKSVSTVLWQPGGIVPGEATLVGDLMRRSGLASHSKAIGMGQADYLSLETVLADPPDLLLVAGRERSQGHPALAYLSAMRIERFDPSLLYCGGPTIIRAAARLAEVRQ